MTVARDPPPPVAELLMLQSGVNLLGDEQLRRVVAMVDTLDERGAVDGLLAPVRSRLAKLRPVRRPTLQRLLFSPLDPLIVRPETWNRGELSIVRSALAPIVKLVLQGMGAETARLRKLAAACQAEDETAMLAIGAKLWPAAGAILHEAREPPGWTATGLAAADFPPIAHALSTLLSHAVETETMIRQARLTNRLTESSVVDLLTSVARHGGSGFGLMSLLLMARLPQISVAMRATRRVAEMSDDSRLNTVADFVMDQGLNGIQSAAEKVAGPDMALSVVADGLEKLHVQLGDVDQTPQAQRSDRRRRISMLRRQIEQAARTRFAATLEEELLAPLSGAAAGAPIDHADVEAKVRALRRLGDAGSSFGEAKVYEQMLKKAVATVSDMPESASLTLVDRVRIVELLLDSDAAMALLQKGPARG